MNLTIAIKDQFERIKELDNTFPIDLILNHLERAEHLYNLALKDKDENYFTDVIYRTNQVFEGVLRIAYMVLATKTEIQTLKKRTIEIEEYLTKNKILKDRVLSQFSNYRKEWRNPSTHDFKILFTESESILAISNVSAFTYVLLNQVIQKLAYNHELKTKTENRTKINQILNRKSTAKNKLISLLIQFNQSHNSLLSKEFPREVEINGALTAYLSSSAKIKLNSEVPLQKDNSKARVDVIVEIDGEKFIIEIKRPNTPIRDIYIQQIRNYLYLLDIQHGILYIPNSKEVVYHKNPQLLLLDDKEVTLIY